MALSRFRLRLALAFAMAFTVGLVALAAVSLGFLWIESSRRLVTRLERLSNDVGVNLAFELKEAPDSSAQFVATEVVNEWPRNGGTYVICDSAGALLASTDGPKVQAAPGKACGNQQQGHFKALDSGGESIQVVANRFRLVDTLPQPPQVVRVFDVVAWASTSGISEDAELLLAAIGIAAPLILLLSMSGGYLMARRALRPVTELEDAISSIAPTDLSRRLLVVEPRDELGALAATFNGLLGRLNAAQLQNRKFLREAAHQIRTPLTLVLGEAAFALSAPEASPEGLRGSLTRIGLAAERMRRRVDELFLLAEAQTGERVRLTEFIELDGLVLGAVDLMRPRSTGLGRALAIGVAQPVAVWGNAELLHEALLELLENALRHGDTSMPVTVSAFAEGTTAVLEVVSAGSSFTLPEHDGDAGPQGLGLPIVRWVVEVHGGKLTLSSKDGRNVLRMTIPMRMATNSGLEGAR